MYAYTHIYVYTNTDESMYMEIHYVYILVENLKIDEDFSLGPQIKIIIITVHNNDN